MGSLSLSLGIGGAPVVVAQSPLTLLPALATLPVTSGDQIELSVLSADGSDTWTYGGSPATVIAREYRLRLGGTVVAGPQPGANLTLPADAGGQIYSYDLRVTVAEGAGARSNWTPVRTGTVLVAAVAPSLAASDALAGRTVTITVDSLSGVPLPAPTLATLTLGGVNVRDDATGSGPWTYTVPSSAADQIVAWTVQATNASGTDQASGSELVPAVAVAPSLAASDALAGRTVTITVNSLSGVPLPAPTLATLTLGGVNVRDDATGSGPWTYTVPSSAADQIVAWTVQATNASGTDQASGSELVPAVAVAPETDIIPTAGGVRILDVAARGSLNFTAVAGGVRIS